HWLLHGAVVSRGGGVDLQAATPPQGSDQFDLRVLLSVVLLYFGAAALVPLVIVMVAPPVTWVVAAALGVRAQVLGDEIVRAPFRAGAISAALMVGLSLIVGLVVWG